MWDNKRYEEIKQKCQSDISSQIKNPYDYMMIYKDMIAKEDYEAAKAITEVLEPMKYYTADTHNHIRSLKQNKNQ